MEIDFHGIKRKDLQTLCKKHGIPANLKNIEMANRLASLFKKETEETDISPVDLVEADGNNAKKVSFSPEIEVFEFTKSVKKRQRKSVRSRSQGKQVVDKGIITVVGSNENESDTRIGIVEVEKAHKVPRRSKRICSGGSTHEGCKVTDLMAPEQIEDKGLCGEIQFEKVGRRSTRLAGNILEPLVEGGTSKARTLLTSKRVKRLVDSDDNVTELSVDLEVKEHHMKNVQNDSKVEKVPRRSRRFVNEIDVQTNTQDLRRSVRVRAVAANPSVCSAYLSKEERKTKQSKGSAVINSQEDELVGNKTKEPLIDCEVIKCPRMKVQDVSQVKMVTRRSRRLGNKFHVPLVDENVKDVKRDDQGVEKAPRQSRKLEKSVSELLVDCEVQTGDKQLKRTSGNDHEDLKLLRRSKRNALYNTPGQAMSSSPKRCSVIDSKRGEASVDNSKKFNVNDEMQVSVKAAKVVEGNLVGTKTDETLDSLVKSSKRVTRSMKRDRSAQPRMDVETASTQDNLTQESIKNKPPRIIEVSPFSSKTKAAESVIENGLDSTPEKSVDSQKTNTQELNSELMEGECEEKLQCVTVSTAVIEEEKEEVSSQSKLLIKSLSPASVQLAASSTETELLVPTGHIRLKDVEEENTKTKDETLISSPRYELKEHNSAANLAKVEVTMENSVECCKEIHLSNEDKKGSLEKEVQAEEEMEISKVGSTSMGIGHCVKLTPEKLGDKYVELEPEEAGGPNVNHESLKDKPQGMVEHSLITSETKATEAVMIFENVFVSTLETSIDTSPNTKELHVELMERDREEKREQDTTVNQESLEDKPQGMVKDSPFTSETKATEAVMISENVFLSTLETSVDTLSRRNTQELHVELMEGERKEKREQDTATLNTVNQECFKDKPQGMVEDSPFTSETKATESVMISENVFDSRLKTSVDISPRNTQEWNMELMEGECEEKREQDIALMPEIMEREEASSPSVFLMEGSEVNKPEAQFDHIEENIKTNEEIPNSIPRSELKEQSFVAKSAEAGSMYSNSFIIDVASKCIITATVQNPAEWWNEIQSSKDDERGSLEKDLEAPNIHENFSECNTENSSAEEQVETSKVGCISSGHCVNLQSVDKVTVEIFERTISCEMRALSRPLLVNKAASSFHDESTVFTTPEKNLFLISENGKTCAVGSVTHHNDEAVESHAVISTTPKQVLQMGDGLIDEARKEEEHTATDFPDVVNTTKRCLMLGSSRNHKARNEEGIVVELHDEPEIETSPLRQSSVEDFKGDEDNRTVGLHCESQRHELLGNSVLDEAESSRGEFYKESLVFTGLEERNELSGDKGKELCAAEKHLLLEDNIAVKPQVSYDFNIVVESQSLMRDSEQGVAKDKYRENKDVFISPERHNAGKQDRQELVFKNESAFTRLESRLLLGESGSSHRASSPIVISKDSSNTVADSSASKVSYSNEFNVEQEAASAEFMPKGSQTQETSKQSREHSPQIDSDLLDFDIEEAETINVCLSSYVLALPAKGTCETIDEISSHLEVTETCSMVSEEGIISPCTNIHQINNALQELAITDELKDEATSPFATTFAADEATPSPEQTSNESSENRKDESNKLCEKQVRREPILIYGTQIKPKLHDMKENVLNSKIVDNLNVTALKRQPLRDLKKMN